MFCWRGSTRGWKITTENIWTQFNTYGAVLHLLEASESQFIFNSELYEFFTYVHILLWILISHLGLILSQTKINIFSLLKILFCILFGDSWITDINWKIKGETSFLISQENFWLLWDFTEKNLLLFIWNH